jgi:hypothetical protein
MQLQEVPRSRREGSIAFAPSARCLARRFAAHAFGARVWVLLAATACAANLGQCPSGLGLCPPTAGRNRLLLPCAGSWGRGGSSPRRSGVDRKSRISDGVQARGSGGRSAPFGQDRPAIGRHDPTLRMDPPIWRNLQCAVVSSHQRQCRTGLRVRSTALPAGRRLMAVGMWSRDAPRVIHGQGRCDRTSLRFARRRRCRGKRGTATVAAVEVPPWNGIDLLTSDGRRALPWRPQIPETSPRTVSRLRPSCANVPKTPIWCSFISVGFCILLEEDSVSASEDGPYRSNSGPCAEDNVEASGLRSGDGR